MSSVIMYVNGFGKIYYPFKVNADVVSLHAFLIVTMFGMGRKNERRYLSTSIPIISRLIPELDSYGINDIDCIIRFLYIYFIQIDPICVSLIASVNEGSGSIWRGEAIKHQR